MLGEFAYISYACTLCTVQDFKLLDNSRLANFRAHSAGDGSCMR